MSDGPMSAVIGTTKAEKTMAEDGATPTEFPVNNSAPRIPPATPQDHSKALDKIDRDSARLNVRLADLRQQMKMRAQIIRKVVEISGRINEQTRVISALNSQLKTADEDPAMLQALRDQIAVEQRALEALEKELQEQRQLQHEARSNALPVKFALNSSTSSSSSPGEEGVVAAAEIASSRIQESKIDVPEKVKTSAGAMEMIPAEVENNAKEKEMKVEMEETKEEILEVESRGTQQAASAVSVLDRLFDVINSPEMFAVKVLACYLIQQYRSKL